MKSFRRMKYFLKTLDFCYFFKKSHEKSNFFKKGFHHRIEKIEQIFLCQLQENLIKIVLAKICLTKTEKKL